MSYNLNEKRWITDKDMIARDTAFVCTDVHGEHDGYSVIGDVHLR